MNIEPSTIATAVIGTTTGLAVYLFFRQGRTGPNDKKLAELALDYGSKYRFRFTFSYVTAQVLPGAEFDEDEALRITGQYFAENGQARKSSYPFKFISFLDAKGRHIFSGTYAMEGQNISIKLLRLTKTAEGRPAYELVRQSEMSSHQQAP